MESFLIDNTWQCYVIVSLLIWLFYEMVGWSEEAKDRYDGHDKAIVVIIIWPVVIMYIIFLAIISIPGIIMDIPGIILNFLRDVKITEKPDKTDKNDSDEEI
jgi:hypothetical protein